MQKELNTIFQLEEAEKFDEAFEAYNVLFSQYLSEYIVWKHFYFFLWMAIEDATSVFHEKIDLRNLLKGMFDEGNSKFSSIADFNFTAGYTVSIFPYEYGDYDDLTILQKECY